MNEPLFESLREWVSKTRRSKDSKKPSLRLSIEAARVHRSGGIRPGAAAGEIMPVLEHQVRVVAQIPGSLLVLYQTVDGTSVQGR